MVMASPPYLRFYHKSVCAPYSADQVSTLSNICAYKFLVADNILIKIYNSTRFIINKQS